MNVLIWFKRDLRIHDHAALALAADMARDMGGAVLPLFIAEPEVWAANTASARQWAGMADALGDLRDDLGGLGAPLVIRVGAAVEVLSRLTKRAKITHIVSHMETGCEASFARDRAVAAWARRAGVSWQELPQSGVRRGFRGRAGWAMARDAYVATDLVPAPQALRAVQGIEAGPIPSASALRMGLDPCPHRQNAGRVAGLAVMDSFFAVRGVAYAGGISSPLLAERACARISPHLALGSLSLREVSHGLAAKRAERLPSQWARSLAAFESRLAWRDHFIQKLEDQPNLDNVAMQPASDALGRARDAGRLAAWSAGQTGLPFVDAAMRYLNATGWINFRARAMLTSFATYHLWLDWRDVGAELARKFTDYEPGIHWPQIQMQSGVTGVNIPRIYNPIKQGLDQDPTGRFIRQWLPELSPVPDAHVHAPWRWSGAGQILGRRYPEAVVEPSAAAREAKARLSVLRATPRAKAEEFEVLERHTAPSPRRAPSQTAALPQRKAAPDTGQMVMEF
jgi:deoxyribodipyrimidine photo-lyase